MNKNFGTILKKLRKERSLYQKDLAEELKTSREMINHLENGRQEPNLDMLEKIADYFLVTTDYLLGRESRQPTDKSNKLTDK